MTPEVLNLILLGGVLLAILLGLPLAFSLGGVAALLTMSLWGPNTLYNIVLKTYDGMANFVLIAIPLFIFMATVLQHSGIADRLYESIYRWAGPLPGGLAMGTVAICAIFAAMAGVTAAATVSMGKIALPSMLQRGYDKRLAVGAIAAGGALGILIPPSVTMVILGLFAEISVGALFLGGVFAGLLLAAIFIVYIGLRCLRSPQLGPPVPLDQRYTWAQKLAGLKGLILPIIMISLVLGSIFSGAATPTEGAAVGAIGSLLCAASLRRFNWDLVKLASRDSFRLSAMIMWIVFGAVCFTALYQATGAGQVVRNLFDAVPGGRWGVVIMMQIVWFVMGMFLDPNGIIMITAPLFFPLVREFGFSPVWFGVLFVVNMQMGFLTPPFGYNLFYMKSVVPPSITLADIYRSIVPFVVLQAIGLALCMVFPQIILWLPGLVLT